MKLLQTLALAALLGSSVTALADKAPEKPVAKEPAKEPSADDVKKWLAFFDSVVDTVVADKDNCDKMGGDLDALFTKNADLIKVANDAKAKGQKLPKDAQDHMLAGVKKMATPMQGCMKNDKVKGAFAKFDGKNAKK